MDLIELEKRVTLQEDIQEIETCKRYLRLLLR